MYIRSLFRHQGFLGAFKNRYHLVGNELLRLRFNARSGNHHYSISDPPHIDFQLPLARRCHMEYVLTVPSIPCWRSFYYV